MFKNEVLVDKTDKERLVTLLREANAILEKYPHSSDCSCHTITTMSRTKGFAKDAEKWCNLLDVKE